MANPTNSVYLQCLIGMQCNDFSIIAADQTDIVSVIVMKDDADKLFDVTDKLVMGVIGSPGDVIQFAQFIMGNVQLYKVRNGYPLGTCSIVHFTRKTLVDTLKTPAAKMLNMLMAGYSNTTGGELYTMDFLGSCMKVPIAVHGIGGLIVLSILERHYRPTLTEQEAYEVIKLCVDEIHRRLFLNLRKFQVKIVSKDGIKTMPCIDADALIEK